MTSQASSSSTTQKIYLKKIVEKIESFPLKANRFEIMQHTKNSGEGLLQPPPPSPTLYHGTNISIILKLKSLLKQRLILRILNLLQNLSSSLKIIG